MTRQLPAYLQRRVGVQILALLAVLTAMLQLLELLDVTPEILDRGQGVSALMYYAVLRLPAELGLALPLAVLLGTMTALNAMARTSEITAMRASGVSLMRMLGYLLPVFMVIAGAQVAIQQLVLPPVEIELKRWWSASTPPDEKEATRLWAHTSAGLVSIDTFSPDGQLLQGVRLYERETGLLSSRLRADSARWDGRAWQLTEVTELRLQAGEIHTLREDARVWQTNLHPDEVLRLGVARPYLSTIMLNDVIVGTRVGSQPLSYYQTALYRSYAAPFGVFIMLLLAMPTAATRLRDSGGGGAMVLALALGLAFLLSDGIMASLGSSGQLPPLLTAVAAPLLFISIALLRLRACERP